jgi:hypothetical protein
MIEKTHLEIYEILDRFELLYPENQDIADFRRAYIDQDISSIFRFTKADEELRKAVMEKNLHSIFRLLPNKVSGDIDDLRRAVTESNLHSIFRLIDSEDIDDLRRAVTESNLHSIFRLIDSEDFRKVIMEDNYWSLWKLLGELEPTHLVAAFKNFYVNETNFATDCFSRGQLESKLWLVNTLKKLNVELGTVFLCAGWYATLATMIFESGVKVDKIRSFDLDPSTMDIAKVFNKPWVMDDWKFQAAVDNIHDIDFNYHTFIVHRADGSSAELTENPDTIINTSCEHIENFEEWYAKIPDGKLVILQSNNYFEVKEHTNCSKTLEAFKKQTPMTTELYSDELLLPKYKRFMRIGYK